MRVVLGILVVLVLLVLGLVVVVYSGVIEVAARAPINPVLAWVADTIKRQSVRSHARGINVPQMGPEMVEEGARFFQVECVQCHGAPGAASQPFARAMRPEPPDLSDAVRRWNAAEMFWITKNGLALTGMPGWGAARVDAELWPVIAFLGQLPTMDAARWQALTAPPPSPEPEQPPPAEADVVPPSEGEVPAGEAPAPGEAPPSGDTPPSGEAEPR